MSVSDIENRPVDQGIEPERPESSSQSIGVTGGGLAPSVGIDGNVGGMVMATWAEQDTLLRDLWGQNLNPTQIAEKLNRSVAAVMTRAARLGLPRRFAPGRKAGQRYDQSNKATSAPAKRSMVRPNMVSDEDSTLPQMSERVCLMCMKKFMSEGRHNRICPSCKGSSDYIAGSRIPDVNYGM